MQRSLKHRFSNELRKELKEVFKNIKDYSHFNILDLENIKCAFQKFYNEAIFWLNILDTLKPKEIFFMCHYHKEGLIYSAKKLGIKIIEYQHGLIAKSDVFYNFPTEINQTKNDCLFPDEMRVHGIYWKNLLSNCNFLSEKTIKLYNYSHFLRKDFNELESQEISSFTKNRKIILITTQTYLSLSFIKYTDILLSILEDEYCVIIKPHPNEDISLYDKYSNTENVLVSSISSDLLLSIANFHITIYSSTAFDALRYKLATYYIYVEQCSDYIYDLQNILGGYVIKDYNEKPWEIKTKLNVQIDNFYKI